MKIASASPRCRINCRWFNSGKKLLNMMEMYCTLNFSEARVIVADIDTLFAIACLQKN